VTSIQTPAGATGSWGNAFCHVKLEYEVWVCRCCVRCGAQISCKS